MYAAGLALLRPSLVMLTLLVLLAPTESRRRCSTRPTNPCELKGCPHNKAGHINVHVLSHSHNDAGWLDTLDDIYNMQVKRIYSSTLGALGKKHSWRYVSAENVFFSRWWQEQSHETKESVKKFVNSGQLQFVGGGWVQNDEAVTHYTAIIDQMTLGLRFLNDTFGPRCGTPSVAWQADPFGHTAAQAALFTRMGFSSLMIGRISVDRFEKWNASRHMQFIWEADDLKQGGDGTHLLTWVPPYMYIPPEPLCFESRCPFATQETKERTAPPRLLNYAKEQARMYGTDTVMAMSGDDLSFTTGDTRFPWQEKLLKLSNNLSSSKDEQLRVHFVHSSPACYIEALHAASWSWPSFKGDLMPYTDQPGRTWTGFYTSRPNLKMMMRYANGFLQASKQLSVLAGKLGTASQVRALGEAVATMQHHDAITGTSTSSVAKDYARILYRGLESAEKAIATGLVTRLMPGHSSVDNYARHLRFCHLLNQSDCPYTTRESEFNVLVYNPASIPVSPYVRIPLGPSDTTLPVIRGPGNNKIVGQVVPLPPHRHGIPESLKESMSSLVFQASVSPLGASLYRVEVPQSAPREESLDSDFLELVEAGSFIENERYRIVLNRETGLISRVILRHRNVSVKLRQSFAVYLSEQDPGLHFGPPGHYVFSAIREAQDISDAVTYRIVQGPVVHEVHQIFNDYASQMITLHKDSPFIEFTWTVGPVTHITPIGTAFGYDVVSQFQSDLVNQGFYTDSNGWRDVHRTITIMDDRLTIPSNYYPITSWIYIKDQGRDLQMILFPDRPQGGSSLREGHLELMLHRAHATNDNLGNDENLHELGVDGKGLVARGTHRLFLGTVAEAQRLMRPEALQLVYRPLLAFAPPKWKPEKLWFMGLRSLLPSTVHVLTLERLSARQVLLRLEHLSLNNTPILVGITRLLSGLRLEDVQPLTLGANQFLPGPSRHVWREKNTRGGSRNTCDYRTEAPELVKMPESDDVAVKLHPGEIATFMANLAAD